VHRGYGGEGESYEVPASTSTKLDVCQILLKKEKENLLSLWVAKLTVFQCSKVIDEDDDTYPI
jgi:hypothetical protein